MSPRVAARLFLVAALGTCCSCGPGPAPPQETLKQARSALAQKQFDRAEELAGLVPESSGEWAAAKTIAGEAATKAGRPADALQHYLSLSRSPSPKEALQGQFFAAEIYRDLGRLAEAERAYRAVLARDPKHVATHERLTFLLGITGQAWEALPHYWFLARSGTAKVDELVLLADLDRPLEHREFVDECAKKVPDDKLVQLGLAAHIFWKGEHADAERRFRTLLADDPNLISAQAMLGELLIDKSKREFLEWHARLPEAASGHPEIWHIRGLRAKRQGEPRVAAHCFWQAAKLAPGHRRATYQLGQVLVSLGEQAGAEFVQRADLLIQLTRALDDILRTQSRREEPFRKTTELMEAMGRIWETCAWALAARQKFPEAEWPGEVFSRLSGKLTDDLPLTTAAANLALRYDLSSFPDHRELFAGTGSAPAEIEAAQPAPGSSSRHLPVKSSIRFIEEAREAGLDFVYFNGPDPSTKGVRMFEPNGGGVAVLDFDGDGRPDLYFSQGSEWAHDADAPTPSDRYTDRLYRNAGGAFTDVTSRTGLGDPGYGQGCTAGDIDSDGFPDLYTANIGRNRLYRNNGDGTFSDVTAHSGIAGETWTASCVIVDLNADGFPDVFDVTYLQGEGMYRAICAGLACSPVLYGGAPDRLHVSRGDWTFESAPIEEAVENSKGLGVVAADIHDRGRPSLFIANDQVSNFLLRNAASDDRFGVRLRDEALVGGVAFNEDGLAMASMGIAADDANGDGRLDFFITTFTDESATLYLQEAPGLFVDGTKPSGLRAATWPFVGWGTQFLDADLDGQPDLVAANGHVDDYRPEGGEYHMRPQFFRNTGGTRFVELFADEIGPYFGEKYLGRGLARLDWNGDGRMDFVVSNIGQPASLVTNQSTGTGRFLNVRLHATKTARDAIGAVVEVVANSRRWSKQLVAGDGYMASNERVLQFGLGDADLVTELHVHWPSGATTTLRELSVNATIQLVEGANR